MQQGEFHVLEECSAERSRLAKWLELFVPPELIHTMGTSSDPSVRRQLSTLGSRMSLRSGSWSTLLIMYRVSLRYVSMNSSNGSM